MALLRVTAMAEINNQAIICRPTINHHRRVTTTTIAYLNHTYILLCTTLPTITPIPSPPGLPIIGNAIDIDPVYQQRSFSDLADKYGTLP